MKNLNNRKKHQPGGRAKIYAGRRQFRSLHIVAAIVLSASWVLTFYYPAGAAISHRNSASNGNSGSTSLSINKPADTQDGDLMIAVIGVRGGSGTTITPPSGWTQVNNTNSGSTLRSATYYKVASSEGSSYNFSFSSSQRASGVISSYSGVDPTNPIHASSIRTNSSSSTMTADSVTTTVDGAMLVAMYSMARSTTFDEGSGMTVRGQASSSGGSGSTSRTTSGIQDQMQDTAGSSGNKTMTGGNSAVSIGHLVALNPAGARPQLSQGSYRWYQNADNINPGTPLADQNTPASTGQHRVVRLRQIVNVIDNTMTSAIGLKLQYGEKVAACADVTYIDLPSTVSAEDDVVAFANNASISDGVTISNGNSAYDPSDSLATVYQTYNEMNDLNLAADIDTDESGLWDMAITYGDSVDGIYCFRAVYDDGTLLEEYMQYPELSIVPASAGATLDQQMRGGQAVINGEKLPFSW